MDAREIAKLAVNALEDKKAQDIKVIDISEISTIADYFIIASGNNRSQIQAMCDHVEEELALGRLVGLHALEDHLRVVQHAGGRVNGDRCIGDDTSVMPALPLVVVHDEHMVGEILTEVQVIGIGLLLRVGRAGHGEGIVHRKSLFSV